MQLPRVLAAPMAGGPTTPALVNAVSFGFLALGTCTPCLLYTSDAADE